MKQKVGCGGSPEGKTKSEVEKRNIRRNRLRTVAVFFFFSVSLLWLSIKPFGSFSCILKIDDYKKKNFIYATTQIFMFYFLFSERQVIRHRWSKRCKREWIRFCSLFCCSAFHQVGKKEI